MEPHELGRKGEIIACEHLRTKGFKIIFTNYYCRYGELDIVARDPSSWVFVEVKCRRSAQGFEQAIGPKKIKCLHLAARSYLQRAGLEEEDYRFMILFILFPENENKDPIIHMIEDPF